MLPCPALVRLCLPFTGDSIKFISKFVIVRKKHIASGELSQVLRYNSLFYVFSEFWFFIVNQLVRRNIRKRKIVTKCPYMW